MGIFTARVTLLVRYSEGEIRFNLMAIVSDRKMIYERKIAELQTHLTEVGASWCEMFLRTQFSCGLLQPSMSLCPQEEPMDTDQSANLLSSIQSEIAKYQLLIEEENQKLKKYKVRPYFLSCTLFLSVTFVHFLTVRASFIRKKKKKILPLGRNALYSYSSSNNHFL